MRMFALFLVVGAIAIAAPAFAGWDRTQWGMSRAEVLAAYPQAVEESENFQSSVDALPQTKRVLVLQKWAFAGREWTKIEFQFDGDGGLVEIKLDTTDRFNDLRNELGSQFGAPVGVSPECSGSSICERQVAFVDKTKHNQITAGAVEFLGESTWLTYRPLSTGF